MLEQRGMTPRSRACWGAATVVLLGACGSRSAQAPVAMQVPWEVQPREHGADHATYFIGGDSRGDAANVLRWAFGEARKADAKGFIFLGDMEWSRKCDDRFLAKMRESLDPVPIYPALGNHEVRWFGAVRYPDETQRKIRDHFVRTFLGGVRLPVVPEPSPDSARVDSCGPAPTGGEGPSPIYYSVDLDSGDGNRGLHFIALDNVSRKGGGFGPAQIQWLAEDLRAARQHARFIIVGMHKPFAGTCAGTHSMAEDGAVATCESNLVASTLAGTAPDERPVDAVFASHDHYFAEIPQPVGDRVLKEYVTGGLGAHLKQPTCPYARAVHHVLRVDVSQEGLFVFALAWPGPQHMQTPDRGDDDDFDEKNLDPPPPTDGDLLPDVTCASNESSWGGSTASSP